MKSKGAATFLAVLGSVAAVRCDSTAAEAEDVVVAHNMLDGSVLETETLLRLGFSVGDSTS
jgi:hypothetical protein